MKEIVNRASSLFQTLNGSLSGDMPFNLQADYLDFMRSCGGGYTGDYFFHFFPFERSAFQADVYGWNSNSLWKHYFGLGEDAFVFAEDIFGTQFFFDTRGNRRVVKMLIPDGGAISLCANTFEGFLENEVLESDSNSEIRQMAAIFFKTPGNVWRPNTHISSVIPVCLGGSDKNLSNLKIADSLTNIKILGQIKQQVKQLPAGTKIRDLEIDASTGMVTLVI